MGLVGERREHGYDRLMEDEIPLRPHRQPSEHTNQEVLSELQPIRCI